MAGKKRSKSNAEAGGFLAAAAQTVGHAAGEAAKALGFEGGVAPSSQPDKSPKRGKSGGAKRAPSARARRSAKAAGAKQAAASLGREVTAGDVRFRRIMGKAPAIWSDEDIRYIDGLTAGKTQETPA